MFLLKLVQTEQTQSQVRARSFPIPVSVCFGKNKNVIDNNCKGKLILLVNALPTPLLPYLYLA